VPTERLVVWIAPTLTRVAMFEDVWMGGEAGEDKLEAFSRGM
jgi:hypothetical protein